MPKTTVTLLLFSLACGSDQYTQQEPEQEQPSLEFSVDDQDNMFCAPTTVETEQARPIGTAQQAISLFGGDIPHPGLMGAWDNGTRDPIPNSSSYLSYSWDSNFSPLEEDYVAWALADVDRQTSDFRLPYDETYGGGNFHVDFVTSDVIPPRCVSPTGAGNCVLGEVTCPVYTENAGSAYRVCSLMRLRLWVDNLNAYITSRGHNEEYVWHNVILHEAGHVLGLPHSDGVMSPSLNNSGTPDVTGYVRFTPCQLATLRDFNISTTTPGVWNYVAAPAECD